MSYPKNKAIENLRNTTEFLQFTMLGLCLATSETAAPIHSVEQVRAHLGSCIVDLTEFTKEFIKDRTHQKRLDSTLVKLLSSGVSMAFNVAKKYYESKDKIQWNAEKRWASPYPYAAQIRNMFSHGMFWEFHSKWVRYYENNGGHFPITYLGLKIDKNWNGRKSLISDITPCGDLISLIEDIIKDISES